MRLSVEDYDLLISNPRFKLNKINSVDFLRARDVLFASQENLQKNT